MTAEIVTEAVSPNHSAGLATVPRDKARPRPILQFFPNYRFRIIGGRSH